MNAQQTLVESLARNPKLEGVPRDWIAKEAGWLVNRLEGLADAGVEPSDQDVDRMMEETVTGLLMERPV
jgi:hypothetical protein